MQSVAILNCLSSLKTRVLLSGELAAPSFFFDRPLHVLHAKNLASLFFEKFLIIFEFAT